jgi:hypothetical protein
MNHLLKLFLLAYAPLTMAQESTSGLRPGARLAAVFSAHDKNGITPMLSADYRGHQLSVGPRILFDRVIPYKMKMPDYEVNRQLLLDISYRYFPMRRDWKVKPFAALSGEIDRSRSVYYQDYETGGMQPYGPSFDHSFRGKWDNKRRYVNIYAGLGAEIALGNHFQVAVDGGFGAGFSKRESTLTDTSNGVVEYSQNKAWGFNETGWIATAACGYRF